MHFCTLNWSPWSELMETEENLLFQTRSCKICNRIITRKAPNMNGLSVDKINAALDSVTEDIKDAADV